MFGLGVWEFALVLLVALLVLGPERLPKVARTLGRGMRELRRAMSEFQSNLASVDIEEQRAARKSRNRFPPPSPTSAETSGPTFEPTESKLDVGDDANADEGSDSGATANEEKATDPHSKPSSDPPPSSQ